MKFLFDLILWIGLIIIITVVISIGVSRENGLFGFHPYLVQSGSMEPSIMTGDVILVRNQDHYEKNQVITFQDKSRRVVTHRIVGMEIQNDGIYYQTKGDANRSGDQASVSEKEVVGAVVSVVPKLGYVVSFIKSRWGILLLIVIPGILVIFSELWNIFKKK